MNGKTIIPCFDTLRKQVDQMFPGYILDVQKGLTDIENQIKELKDKKKELESLYSFMQAPRGMAKDFFASGMSYKLKGYQDSTSWGNCLTDRDLYEKFLEKEIPDSDDKSKLLASFNKHKEEAFTLFYIGCGMEKEITDGTLQPVCLKSEDSVHTDKGKDTVMPAIELPVLSDDEEKLMIGPRIELLIRQIVIQLLMSSKKKDRDKADYVERYFLKGEELKDIANSCGKSSERIRQIVENLRTEIIKGSDGKITDNVCVSDDFATEIRKLYDDVVWQHGDANCYAHMIYTQSNIPCILRLLKLEMTETDTTDYKSTASYLLPSGGSAKGKFQSVLNGLFGQSGLFVKDVRPQKYSDIKEKLTTDKDGNVDADKLRILDNILRFDDRLDRMPKDPYDNSDEPKYEIKYDLLPDSSKTARIIFEEGAVCSSELNDENYKRSGKWDSEFVLHKATPYEWVRSTGKGHPWVYDPSGNRKSLLHAVIDFFENQHVISKSAYIKQFTTNYPTHPLKTIECYLAWYCRANVNNADLYCYKPDVQSQPNPNEWK